MKKIVLIVLALVIIMIGLLIINYNPVINESVFENNKAKFLKDGIIVINPSVTNCFLLKNGDKYVLIDTVYEHELDSFNKALEQVDVKLSDISHIILTHHHDDHVGLLNKLTTENPDIKVVMSKLAKNLILEGENNREHNGGFVNKWVRLIKVINNKFDK
ncbi:MAG: MBL fold metallo-hydrolase, partial [Halothermotrichaceae bacterium]